MTIEQVSTATDKRLAKELAEFDWGSHKAEVSLGARIELLVAGSASEALAAADEWAVKLAHGAKLDAIGLTTMSDGRRWKVTIQFKEKYL